MDIQSLYSKPIDEDFTDDEIRFLKKHFKKNPFTVKYAFYNKSSTAGKYITYLWDLMPHSPRKSPVENYWQIIETRKPNDNEIMEYILFYFRESHKRFVVWYYQKVEKLVHDDQCLKNVTPEKFVEQCIAKGFWGNYQTKLDLINT